MHVWINVQGSKVEVYRVTSDITEHDFELEDEPIQVIELPESVEYASIAIDDKHQHTFSF